MGTRVITIKNNKNFKKNNNKISHNLNNKKDNKINNNNLLGRIYSTSIVS